MTRMRLAAGLAAALLAVPALAVEDPIEARQSLMSANGAVAAAAGAMLKDEIPYSPVVAKAVISTLDATGRVLGDLFPDGTLDPSRSEAAPKIWEDPDAFTAEIVKFEEAASAAAEAAGRAGPADKAAFAAAIQPVLQTCQSCHEGFRTRN